MASHQVEKISSDIHCVPQFYCAEELGLVLFMHVESGKKFCMERECWEDIVTNVKNGLLPKA